MFDGAEVVRGLKSCGVTHVIWIPDSELGTWESALRADPDLRLVRVTREGEAFGLAAGLALGGKRPVVVIQCTGLFEAGDALRNVVHDLKLPLFLIVGLRGYYAHQKGQGFDTCPLFAEPVLSAWRVPYRLLDRSARVEDLTAACRRAFEAGRAEAVFIAE